MPDTYDISKRQKELAEREWNVSQIEARFGKLVSNGITPKTLDRGKTLREKEAILDRVQRQAEDYC